MVGPIFIVGASRSGTELARSVLNRHPRIHIAVETHWFDDMRPRLADPGAASTGAERDAVLDYLSSLDGHGYGLRSTDGAVEERAELDRAWGRAGPTADDAFTALCALQAERVGKAIWGEKTPRHLFRADDILAVFPDAKILVCVRDPRGVVASYRDWRNRWFDRETLPPERRAAVEAEERRAERSFGLTLATLLWRSAATAGLRLRARRGERHVRLLRFEELLAQPERTCRGLAEWLGVGFDPAMLDVAVGNSSYLSAGSVTGFDAGAAGRWRGRLTDEEQRYVAWLARRAMVELGYPPPDGPVDPVFAARRAAAFPVEALRALAANRTRIGDLPRFLLARVANLR